MLQNPIRRALLPLGGSISRSVFLPAVAPATSTAAACIRRYSSSSTPPDRGSKSNPSSSSSPSTPTSASRYVVPPHPPSRAATFPSVPSTEHLHPTDIAFERFFACHRPLPLGARKGDQEKKEEPPQQEVVLGRPFCPPPAPVPAKLRIKVERIAISVKRQRKLKMKKHKYKKLMRKTRNARRKLERQRG